MGADSFVGPVFQAHTREDGQLVVSVEPGRCEQVSLDGRRCWRTKHVDWCCDFEGAPDAEAALRAAEAVHHAA